MSELRKGLDLSKLTAVEPKRTQPASLALTPDPAWPSRESQREVQINIRAPEPVIHAFKEVAYRERLSQAKTLEFLLQLYDRHVKESR